MKLVPITKGHKRNQNSPKSWFRRSTIFVFCVIASVSITTFLVWLTRRDTSAHQSHSTSIRAQEIRPTTLRELLALSPQDLQRCDIARMNLLCAEALHGAEHLNLDSYLARLDAMAKHIELETRRHYYRFQNNRAEFNQSEGYFRMLLMAVTLQEDFGIRYNPDRITAVGEFEPNETFFADSRDVFIHGASAEDRGMGTCSSLPVLYVAIGRRLGYPLKLVPTQNHLFIRWDEDRERFNVDATGRGMNLHDDDYYRNWPFHISPEQEKRFGYLRSMTAADELTTFLSMRGHCLVASGALDDALMIHEAALRLSPDSELQQLIVAKTRELVQSRAALSLLPPQLRDPFLPRPVPAGLAPAGPPDSIPLNTPGNQ